MTFGERIKELRLAANLRRQDIAEKLFVSEQTIYQYEKGINYPRLDMLKKLAALFNVTTDYLLDVDNI